MRRILLYIVLFASACLVAGCASVPSANPVKGVLNWMFGRAAAAEQKNTEKVAETEDELVDAAHVEVVKTAVALGIAGSQVPDNRAVNVATRFNANAARYLNQRDPLSVAIMEEAVRTAQGLVSNERELREAAELSQSATEEKNRTLADQLVAVRDRAKELAEANRAEAAENLRLANELRYAKLLQYASTAASVALGLMAIAYRMNIGRFQESAASVLQWVKTNHGEGAAKTARLVAGEVLHTGEQKGVFKVFSKLNAS